MAAEENMSEALANKSAGAQLRVSRSAQGLSEEEFATRPDYVSSPNDNVIIDGLSGSDSSFGWVGYAYFIENQDTVKALEVADPETGGCVAPTDETIASGEYPLARDLFIYVNNARADESQAVADYVDFYLGDTGYEDVAEAGYVQLTEEAWAETQAAWAAR
jgi:phosphate transport system substrate-binding protein